MNQPLRKRRGRIVDRIMEVLIYASGGVVLAMILAVAYYLTHESAYAFDRKFDYGYRVALQPTSGEYENDLSLDVNASLLTANREGVDGIDEKEETIPMPTIDQLAGSAMFGTGAPLVGNLSSVDPLLVFRDDWRGMKSAKGRNKFLVFGFATPEYKGEKMALAWAPDASFDPNLAPYDLKLKLEKAPEGVTIAPFTIDLKAKPSGRIELPTFVARTDEERTKGYVFALEATPKTNNFAAVIGSVMRSEWDPTNAYAKFGFMPLLVGSLMITLLAVLIATPFSIATAIYLSEVAPSRVREWLKPTIEVLSSVPTVVLGYFGLMLLAPALQETLAKALGLESGRALLTTSIIMAILLIPTITSVAEDALQAVPQSMRDGGEALGLTIKERLKRIILPAAKGGVVAAVLLGFARAIGETMIVWILGGGTASLPSFNGLKDTASNLMKPVRGVPDTIAVEMGNVDFEGVHYGHLFLLGLTLFTITLAVNLIGYRYARRLAWRA